MAKIKALVRGVWHPAIEETPELDAEFARHRGRFRHAVTRDGSSGFPAKAGRYCLYVSYACPWAHRAILYRRLKGLDHVIAMSVLHPRWGGPDGWSFGDTDMSTVDFAGGRRHLHEVYRAAAPDFSGRVTVPVLWDELTRTIVSNESADIIRMLNSAFDGIGGDPAVDFYPEDLQDEIDRLNAFLLPEVCRAVYRVGFARSQAAHDRAVEALFQALDTLGRRLEDGRPYLLGDRVTESDWHLFTCLCRFDAAYHGALRCSLRRLIDDPNLAAYARRLHRLPGVAETVRIDQIKRHYHDDLPEIDRTIVPAGPSRDYRGDDPTRDAAAQQQERSTSDVRHPFEILGQQGDGRTIHGSPQRLAKTRL
ncbi:MAG: glutathione S-transferase C-terminal domain-containing protein [Alphaproteobacteria bacterium]